MWSSLCISVRSVFRVTESPSITDTESPNTPGEHEQVLHRLNRIEEQQQR